VSRSWSQDDPKRGQRYAERFDRLEASGASVHGEADFVAALHPASVLDAGCGTGRVGIELGRRGLDVCGVDRDPAMLAVARERSPEVGWFEADLAAPDLDLGRRFDVVVAAGNVMIFVDAGTEGAVVANLARHLEADGALVAGFQLEPRGLTLARYDEVASAAGLVLTDRFATWDRQPFAPGGAYAVSVHRRAPL
jgi:SAM-dependent methyltransferase